MSKFRGEGGLIKGREICLQQDFARFMTFGFLSSRASCPSSEHSTTGTGIVLLLLSSYGLVEVGPRTPDLNNHYGYYCEEWHGGTGNLRAFLSILAENSRGVSQRESSEEVADEASTYLSVVWGAQLTVSVPQCLEDQAGQKSLL
eukprot:scaffold5108_cov172-Amphora_coffeaeformis.AAC.4